MPLRLTTDREEMGTDHGVDTRRSISTPIARLARTVLLLLACPLLIVAVSSWYLQLSGGLLEPASSKLQRVDHRHLLLDTSLLPYQRRLVDLSRDGCTRKCGNLSIPYPFGLSSECARDSYFQLDCRNTSGVTGHKAQILPGFYPFLTNKVHGSYQDNGTVSRKENKLDSFQVLEINLTAATIVLDTTSIKASSCDYVNSDFDFTYLGNASILLPSRGPYRLTQANVFVVVGCDAMGVYYRHPVINYGNSSASNYGYYDGQCGPNSCANQKNFDFCNAYDCCVESLQPSLNFYFVGGGLAFKYFSTCGYSTLLYPPSYSYYFEGAFGNGTYGAQLMWALPVGEKFSNCSLLEKSEYACSPSPATCQNVNQSVAVQNVSNLVGYYCQCLQAGYEGDGYINGTGCKDIDECRDRSLNQCAYRSKAKCINLEGSYNCTCPAGMEGDGFQNGTRCSDIRHAQKSRTALIAGLAASGAALVLLANGFAIWWLCRKRQQRHLTGTFGSANFSRIDFLRDIQSKEGANICKLFSLEELEKATNNFSIDRILGTGGFGTVFQGTLDTGERVAIKKAKREVGAARNDTKQFINEVTVLSQVNHRNLVKLLGCCLETEVPILVYEFVAKGNLQDHLHQSKAMSGKAGNKRQRDPPILDWDRRLKIAVGAARALSYLHSGTSPPIFHRDVKTANILLDKNYVAKVADFGLSKFVPDEATHVSTAVQGTLGYLDPAYFDTYQVTDKSDVYAFGVILLELITAEKPIDFSRPVADQNLALRCRRLLNFGLFEGIIDPGLGAFSNTVLLGEVYSVAQVAMRCLEKQREDRPAMTKVLEVLESISNSAERPSREASLGTNSQVNTDQDDSNSLVTGTTTNSEAYYFTSWTSFPSSMSNSPATSQTKPYALVELHTL